MAGKIGDMMGTQGIGLDALRTSQIEQQSQAAKKAGTFQEDQAEKASKDFEALLLKQMFDSMWSTVPKDSLLQSRDEAIYRDMYTDALAKNISKNQGLGISHEIYQEMVKKK